MRRGQSVSMGYVVIGLIVIAAGVVVLSSSIGQIGGTFDVTEKEAEDAYKEYQGERDGPTQTQQAQSGASSTGGGTTTGDSAVFSPPSAAPCTYIAGDC